MSNRLFQGVLNQMQDSTDRILGVVDDTSTVIASTDLSLIGQETAVVPDEAEADELVRKDGRTYRFFGSGELFALFAEGEDDHAAMLVNLLAASFSSMKLYYDEKFDRASFVKNVILDNILPGDITVKARELRFNDEIRRAVLLIRISGTGDVSAFDVVQNLFPDKQKDFVLSINDTDIVLVKEVKHYIENRDLEKLARSIVDTLNSEFYTNCNVGIGTIVKDVRDLSRSFKEAQVAIEVGKVFDTDKHIGSYDNLGIARLIYQLPNPVCTTFLREVFKDGSVDCLDQETLFTIQRFFENNLNVSETSRKLFVHRNTLVYRLEKIKKLTGLDLREFEQAIVFKVALMVRKYLDANPMRH